MPCSQSEYCRLRPYDLTLIELLIVVAIIALLVSILLPSLADPVASGRVALDGLSIEAFLVSAHAGLTSARADGKNNVNTVVSQMPVGGTSTMTGKKGCRRGTPRRQPELSFHAA